MVLVQVLLNPTMDGSQHVVMKRKENQMGYCLHSVQTTISDGHTSKDLHAYPNDTKIL